LEDQLELMVEYLVHLQFYSEEQDILYSRDKKTTLSIPGIGPVISAFVKDLKKPLEHIRAGEYDKYLVAIAERLPIEIEQVKQEFNVNTSEFPEGQLTSELAANFLIGPIRSGFQTKHFEETIRGIKVKALRMTKDPVQLVEGRLSDLYCTNDQTVSLLYNLTFLQFLTSIYGTDEVRNRVDLLVQEHCQNLVRKIMR
jgi:hypothetical protein